MKFNCLIIVFFCTTLMSADENKIDVVIPFHEKDMRTLDLVIDGIRNNIDQINRIIIVSSRKFTEKAEWFDESLYPFTKKDIALEIFNKNEDNALQYLADANNRIGWIYQQLLKLYAPLIIPDISSNVLVIDADTIFLKKVAMFEGDVPLFNVGTEHHQPYFRHMHRLLPGLSRVFNHSGITHHMLFQRPIIENLFKEIKAVHNKEPWVAICNCIDRNEMFSGISEYEIYFNYIFSRKYNAKIRTLRWFNAGFDLSLIERCKLLGLDYISCHSYNG